MQLQILEEEQVEMEDMVQVEAVVVEVLEDY
jgi:hypothetical protein